MKKNFGNVAKKAMAVVAMAAAVVTAVPAGQAEAASDCSHRYNTTCLGYKRHFSFNHNYTYYTTVLFIEIPKEVNCTANVVFHGDKTQCVDCGALNGTGEHQGSIIHADCPCSESSCSGSGTVVGGFY